MVGGENDPVRAKAPIFNRYSFVAPQHAPSEKCSIITNMKSTMSLRGTASVPSRPQGRGAQKSEVAVFRSKFQ